MILTGNKIFTWVFSLLILLATVLTAWRQEYYFLAIPVLLLACICLVQFPEYLFYLLVLSIPWSIEYNFTPSLGTDLPDEPLMLLTAMAALILIIHNRKRLNSSFRHPLVIIILIQLVWIMITVIYSTGILVSFKYLLAKVWYLLAFVAAPVYLFRDRKIMERSFVFLLFYMMTFMLFAIIKHAQYNWTFENINDALDPFFRNHVNYSSLLVFMVPVQIAIIQLAASKRLKMVVQCLMFVTIVALYFSYARGAWLALIAGFVSYWLIRKKLLFAGYLLFLLVCITAIFWLKSNDNYLKLAPDYNTTIFHTDFREHLVATYQMKDVSTAERFHRWVAGVRMINDSWKTGFGPTSFFREYKSYTQPAFKTWVSKNEEQSTVHNYFLLLIIEQGAMGLLIFLLLLGVMFWHTQKIYHSTQQRKLKVMMGAVGALLVMQCVINSLSDLIETDKVGSVFYLCLALIIVASYELRSPADHNS